MTTITLRGTKGTPLTNSEVDSNFSNLNTYKVEQTSATGAAALPTGTTAQRPASPVAGNIRYNASTGKFEGYGSAWGNIGGGAYIGDTAPSNPGNGDLWWSSLNGHSYVYYSDGDTSQWVDAFAGGEGQYLPLTGGTISGNVGINVTPTGWLTGSGVQFNGGMAVTKFGLSYNTYYDGSSYKYIASSGSTLYQPQGGVHYWYTAASGTAGTACPLTLTMSLGKGASLALEGASTVSGTGISFPATQLASSDANTLDDYEEGAWTPTITFGGNQTGQTYSVQVGRYTKVGNQVSVVGYAMLSAAGSATGYLYIGGLPFASLNTANLITTGAALLDNTSTSITDMPVANLDSNSTSIGIVSGTAAQNASVLTEAIRTANLRVRVSMTYFV